jgi:SMP-30/Gluconolactonase/LRE-like region
MTPITAVAATRTRFELAEGILRDDRAGLVRWMDIWRGHVLSGRFAKRLIVDIATDGALSLGPDILGDRHDVRLNDGSVDPQGRFVVGSLALGDETGEEMLLRVSPDGTVETLRTGIRLSNSIGFAPDVIGHPAAAA